MKTALACVGIAWLAIAAPAVIGAGRSRDQQSTAGSARTVWDGIFTEAQAARGKAQYAQACASCHAQDLRGDGTAPSLVEESFSFLWDDTTVGELFVRVRTLMPTDRPNSLPAQSYRDIVAFILQSNRFPSGEKELEADADALKQIRIVAKRPEAGQ